MHAYCVQKLHLSESEVFDALGDGRLHLCGVVLLAPRLAPENAHELLGAATHQTKAEIEWLLAHRFPRPELPSSVQAISPPLTLTTEQAPERVQELQEQHAPGRVESPAPPAKVTTLAPQRYSLQVTLGESAHDKLRYAQALLGHAVPAGEIAAVLERALDALIERLEKRKFAATSRPRPGRPCSSARPRHIPAAVKRAVWERDGGRCTFVSDAGQRCPARSRLEYDHIDPVARGGEATMEGIRLQCRGHNQFTAECTFGADFMNHKRREAQRARARERAAGQRNQGAPGHVEARAPQPKAPSEEPDVVPWLQKLGYRAGEARRAAAFCETIPDASLEERLRLALSHLMPPHRRVPATAT